MSTNTDTKTEKKKGKKKIDGQITRCTSKHRIFFDKPDAKEELNGQRLKSGLYEAQRQSARILNAMQRSLWQADGLFLDNYYMEHREFPVGKENKGKWPMPSENLYQLGRRMEPDLASGITATLSHQVFNKWARERFEALVLNRRSPPHYRDNHPIPLRTQDYFISTDGSKFVVQFSLKGGRHEGGKEYKIYIDPKDSFQKKALLHLTGNVPDDEWKLGDASIVRNHRNQWFILFSYKRIIKKAVRGMSAGINRGVRNFVVLSAEDGWKWIYEGQDILAFLHRIQARRRSYQYASKASNRDGRGRRRLLNDPTEHLQGRAQRYRETKNHVIARRLIAECVRRGIGFLYIEDFSGIRNGEPTDLVGGKTVWDLIQEWPCYDLMLKIIDKAEQAGIGHEIVPAHYISQRCPNCGTINPEHKDLRRWRLQCTKCKKWWNLDVAAAKNVLARGKGEWSVDDLV